MAWKEQERTIRPGSCAKRDGQVNTNANENKNKNRDKNS